MLKRIYADNFRCLVNFELRLDPMNLLLGENGTGKTTVFEVLYRLQQFLAGNAKVLNVFPSTELTRWQSTPTQRFELDLDAAGSQYRYSLAIEHDEDRRKARVKKETLTLDGNHLFEFEEGTAKLYHDDFNRGPEYPFDWTQSGLAVLSPRPDNKKLTNFRTQLAKIIVASVYPMCMSSESREEASVLSRNMENFVCWYRYISQEHQGAMFGLFREITKVLPGFSSFSLKEAGEAKVLKVLMKQPGGNGRQQLTFDFAELSDGQRSLIALYSVLLGLKDQGVSVFLDEPDNFITLRELQPWLGTLKDLIGEGVEQAVLISHHPEIIDQLAVPSGRWFERDGNSPSRVSNQPKTQVEGLKPSEAMARGWTK
jgi:predicted ATPase